MPSAIGGLMAEYRGADIRCGLNERLRRGTKGKFAAFAPMAACFLFADVRTFRARVEH